MFLVVSIAADVNSNGFKWIFPLETFLFTTTAVEVPIPTESDGFTFKLITSFGFSSWKVDTDTWDLTFWTLPKIWLKVDSK